MVGLQAASLLLAPLIAGVAAGVAADAGLNLRAVYRTGHTSTCPASRGWSCTC